MVTGQGVTYAVDLVLVIDLTGSMGPVLEEVKARALTFHEDVHGALAARDKEIDDFRVRIVGYRDYFVDGDMSLAETPFYDLPADRERFAAAVKELRPTGGGDEPESGLEALAMAIRSDWTARGTRQRQIIVVWTDASTHTLERGASESVPGYPMDLPKSFDDLTDEWEGQTFMSATGKRLLLFTPDATAWSDISTHWSNTVHFPSKAGQGLRDVDFSAILDTIANSV